MRRKHMTLDLILSITRKKKKKLEVSDWKRSTR
jgi:hypothetical protein